MQAWALPHLIRCVEGQGVDAGPVRRLPWLAHLDDPDARVPESAAESAWALAASLTGDEALGVHVAESLPRGALDLVEYAFRSSPSLGDGLARIARYGRVLSDRLSIRTGRVSAGLLVLVHDTLQSPLHPARPEFALSTMLKLARDTTGAGITPHEVCFAHPAPPNVVEHTRYFGLRVRFAAGANSLTLAAADAERPLAGADTALSEILRRRLDKVLAAHAVTASGGASARVRRLLVEEMGRRAVGPDRAAAALGMSRRTLTRRLAEEGTSFRQLLDEVRADFARTLLRDPALSIADIAFFLDYSEPAAFHRSFRRWTGQTPRAFRGAR